MFEGILGLALVIGASWPRGCRFRKGDAQAAARALGIRFDRERFTARDLAIGMNVEREHYDVTDCNPVTTARIALVHLRERPDYYSRLKRYVE